MGAVCQSQLPLPEPLSQWEGRAHCCSGGRAVQWCLANPLYCQRSINPRSMIKNIMNQINVKCLFLHSNSGEKRANYFAQIMFKHSLATSADSAILYHLSTAVFCPSKNSNYYTQHCGLFWGATVTSVKNQGNLHTCRKISHPVEVCHFEG